MAAPPTRRAGFSRRAQLTVFLGYVVAVGGVLVAILLLIVAAVDPRGFAALRGTALDVTAPVSAAGRSVVGYVSGIGESVSEYFAAASKNAELRRELERTRRELHETRFAAQENERLKEMLGIAAGEADEVTVARIVGSSFDSARRLATLSAGAGSGVEAGQPVRGPDGLIGRVIETGRWAARVLLVSDASSNVPVRSLRDGTPALAVGRGDGTIELKTLEVGENPFRPGDVLVTSGTGGVFPPGIPVARVVRLEGDSAIARPVADPARADYALVLRVFQPAAGAPLDQAAEADAGGPVDISPSELPPEVRAAETPAPAQQDPGYQPALQRPDPVLMRRARPQRAQPRPEQPQPEQPRP